MKVKELIAKLQAVPDQDADVYRCWYVTNDSGTTYDTGELVDRLEAYPAGTFSANPRESRVEIW